MFNAIMPPVSVYLGAVLVNKIAEARLHALKFESVLYIVIGFVFYFYIVVLSLFRQLNDAKRSRKQTRSENLSAQILY